MMKEVDFMDSILNIAVCEDLPSDMARLCAQLKATNRPMQILPFESGEAFLQSFSPGRYQLVFFDIYMKDITGVEAAQALRQADDNCIIIFTTTSREHALESYQLKALRYLVKPTTQEDVEEALAQGVKLLTPKEKPGCNVLSDKKERHILFEEILYAEVYNHRSLIHTTKEVVATYMKIGELEQLLPNPPFLRCHQAYIVNMDYVAELSQDFIMKNGAKVYIPQRNYRKIRDAYSRHLIESVRGGLR